MPSVLKWLSTKLNCTSQIASLLAATSASDVQVVRGIIKENPDLGLYNTQGGLVGGRSALTIAAERGDLEILQIIYNGAVSVRGEAFAKQSLNSGGERGQTPLMRACTFAGSSQHIACVKYLLSMGADPFTETDKGETCLHLAAKNAYTECLTEILSASVSIGGSLPVRLADAVLPYTPPVRFIEMRNAAGFTALHLATLKNSPAAMQVLLGAGACMDAGILDAGNTPHLARGSTALHIAAARGSVTCCNVLLDFELAHPEMDIRRIRNERNLKASQLARLAGHEELALMLRAVPRSPSVSSRDRVRSSRRRRRGQRGSTGSVTHTHSHSRPSISPEAVMDVLIARTQLLLSLREVGLELGISELPKEGLASVQAAHPMPSPDEPSASGKARDEVAAAVAEFTDLWQKGKLEEKEGGGLLSSMVPADLQVAKLPDSILGDSESGGDSYSAAALVQAALNAMAHFSQSAKPLDLPPTQLKPTSPLAAAVVVQVAIRKLAGKGSNYSTTSAATLMSSIHTTHATLPHTGKEHRYSDASRSSERKTKSRHKGSNAPKVPRSGAPRHRPQNGEAMPSEACSVQIEARTLGAPSQAGHSVCQLAGHNERIPTASLLQSHIGIIRPNGAASPDDKCGLSNAGANNANVMEEYNEDPESMPMWEGYEEGGPETDVQAMPMWEGYELGVQDSDADNKRLQHNNLPSHPLQYGSGTGDSMKSLNSLPHSPPRQIPGCQSEERGEWTSGSLSSSISLHKPVEAGLRSKAGAPLRCNMDRKGSVGSGGVMSPSEGSCSTPLVGGMLLATRNTSGTISDSDKEGDQSDEDELDGVDLESRCAICMDQPLHCAVSPCLHTICYGCAYQLCSRGLNIPTCPFCRGPIATFTSHSGNEDC